MRILITGGAGFIGSHLADALISGGHNVRVLDSLNPQVHGGAAERPAYLNGDAELLVGDLLDRHALDLALDGIDVVYHFASVVGVGQSMYEIFRYTRANNLGTAALWEAIIRRPVSRLIVASSMSVYGEGLYQAADGTLRTPGARESARLKAKQWELFDERGEPLLPLPTPETKPATLSSIYALSKFDQERMSLMLGNTYGIPTVALRFFNVFGQRQALSNPYTGVIAIFAARLLNNRTPLLFEDGYQKRDFVHVHDVAAAAALALTAADAPGQILNIGSGQAVSIIEVASSLATVLGKSNIRPEISGLYRSGDIRHCFADISRARHTLDFKPAISLEAGLLDLVQWLASQKAIDRVDEARGELSARGLAW